MDAVIKAWKTSRKLYLEYFDKYSLEQLNIVPEKFNNNLIWNIGHIIAAQQSLVYKTSNLPINIPDEFFDRYKPGTRPTGAVSQNDVNEIRSLLTSMIHQTETDLANGRFISFTERNTITGFHLGNLQDALVFNNYHEGLHLGYMKSIARFV
ncbi:MAG TPA: DinB family protein [Chitinophagaceae bacterium]